LSWIQSSNLNGIVKLMAHLRRLGPGRGRAAVGHYAEN